MRNKTVVSRKKVDTKEISRKPMGKRSVSEKEILLKLNKDCLYCKKVTR
jgi:hypothetical protein